MECEFGGGSSQNKQSEVVVILNSDGSKVVVSEDNISVLINKHFLALQEEWNVFLKEKGVRIGFYCRGSVGLPENTKIIKSFRAQIDEHNQDVIRNLIAHHQRNTQKELEWLAQLAKEFQCKIKWDTNDWNQFALEVSRKERELKGGGPAA